MYEVYEHITVHYLSEDYIPVQVLYCTVVLYQYLSVLCSL